MNSVAFCPQLQSLHLAGNPVEGADKYRQIIANFVPQLQSLDDKAFSSAERGKLSDDEIDAIILTHRKALDAGGLGSSELTTQHDSAGSRQLTMSASTASLGSADAFNDDSGSSLTHGTDIVFAGNVSSALRRHRNEIEANEAYNFVQNGTEGFSAIDSRPSSRHGLPDRPKTPARRISITDTLDRAKEIDTHKHKSRDAIVDELRAWQLESAGVSQVGVPRVSGEFQFGGNFTRSRRKGSIGASSGDAAREKLDRRPRTSAGVLRNGVNVREAFVESDAGTSKRPTSRGSVQRDAFPSRSSTRGVDILVLDGGDADKRPCSPVKTSRGIFTTATTGEKALGRSREWNLEGLSSAVDITTAKRHVPSSLSSKQQRERVLARASGDNGSSDSDSDDE